MTQLQNKALMSKITIEGEGSVRNITFNGKVIAYAVCSETSMFIVEFRGYTGWWDAWALREIADAIDELNKPSQNNVGKTTP